MSGPSASMRSLMARAKPGRQRGQDDVTDEDQPSVSAAATAHLRVGVLPRTVSLARLQFLSG